MYPLLSHLPPPPSPRANGHFFRGLAIVADGFGPGYPQTFINGMTMAAENGPNSPMLPNIARHFSILSAVDPSKALETIQNTICGLPAPLYAARYAFHSPMATAHFYYRMVSRMLMQVLQAVKGGRTIGNVFWNVVADGVVDFENLVESRMRQVCGGMALMSGYSTPMGTLVNRYCNAWIDLEHGLITMSTVFMVDVPLISCVCKGSAGSSFRRHVLTACYPDTPDKYKPLLISLLAQFAEDPSQICPSLVAMTQTHFTEALDPMFSSINAGNTELASVVDSFITVLDPKAGDCNNFQDNPYDLALIPEPIDYFRVCGKTTFCRTKCLSEFLAFEAINLAPPVVETLVESTQSLFFNSKDDASKRSIITPVALMELSDCVDICGNVRTVNGYSDRCFIVAGENYQYQLEVVGYCVPITIGSSVRRGGGHVMSNMPPGGILQAAFVWRPDYGQAGFWSAYKLLLMTTDTMYQCHTVCDPLYSISTLDSDVTKLLRFTALGNTVVQETRYRDGQTSFSTATRVYSYTLVGIYRYSTDCDQFIEREYVDLFFRVCLYLFFQLARTNSDIKSQRVARRRLLARGVLRGSGQRLLQSYDGS